MAPLKIKNRLHAISSHTVSISHLTEKSPYRKHISFGERKQFHEGLPVRELRNHRRIGRIFAKRDRKDTGTMLAEKERIWIGTGLLVIGEVEAIRMRKLRGSGLDGKSFLCGLACDLRPIPLCPWREELDIRVFGSSYFPGAIPMHRNA